MVIVRLATGKKVSPTHLHALFGVGVLRTWSACGPTVFEVVRGSRNFEKHCIKCCVLLSK
jgi:hypothetical protein